MGRSNKPKGKIARRMGVNLFAAPKYDRLLKRKPDPPGRRQQRRRKVSDYGMQLQEKQKLRFTYGIRERQLRRIYQQARRQGSATGDEIARLLEQRLDNTVFRLGMAATRDQARQMVNHGHISVNGSRCDIPSRRVAQGDLIAVKRKKGTEQLVRSNLGRGTAVPRWLSLDDEHLQATVTDAPTAQDIDIPVELQRVVEFYAR
jgi:small subunit ribosomal protein S4